MSSSNNFNHYDCDTKMLEIYNNYQNSEDRSIYSIESYVERELARIECRKHVGGAYLRIINKMKQDGQLPESSEKIMFVLNEKKDCNHNNYYCSNCDTYFEKKLIKYFSKKGIAIKHASNNNCENINNDREWQI